jgi:hypothetical protein
MQPLTIGLRLDITPPYVCTDTFTVRIFGFPPKCKIVQKLITQKAKSLNLCAHLATGKMHCPLFRSGLPTSSALPTLQARVAHSSDCCGWLPTLQLRAAHSSDSCGWLPTLQTAAGSCPLFRHGLPTLQTAAGGCPLFSCGLPTLQTAAGCPLFSSLRAALTFMLKVGLMHTTTTVRLRPRSALSVFSLISRL